MDDKKAAVILIKLLKKRSLNNQEREAISIAIGILSWTSLSKSRVKTLKARQDKSVEWQ